MLCGHEPLLDKFREFLCSRGITTLRVVRSDEIFRVGTTGAIATELIRLFYGEDGECAATVGLQRKVDRAQKILVGR
jgi:hypothetical protein